MTAPTDAFPSLSGVLRFSALSVLGAFVALCTACSGGSVSTGANDAASEESSEPSHEAVPTAATQAQPSASINTEPASDPSTPTYVVITPATTQLGALGATAQLHATAFDENGNLLEEVTFLWQSSDVEVATVDAAGVTTATGAGTAVIAAQAGTASDDSIVTVSGFTLSGTVTDARLEGLAVSDVHVRLRNGAGESTSTDENGRYSFRDVLGPVEVDVQFVGFLSHSAQVTLESEDRILNFELEHSGRPPYGGTVWVTPDILGPSDPVSLRSVTYSGRGTREVFDRRVGAWVDIHAYLFEAQFCAQTVEFQVNPEFGTEEAARAQVDRYALAIGRLPRVLISSVREVEINAGDNPWGGNSYNSSLLIHTGYDTHRSSGSDFVEEVLVHEASHAALDPLAADASWRRAQQADGVFISEYARNHPEREDLAESFLTYFALRHRPERLTEQQRQIFMSTMPNRIAYFDQQQFDLSGGCPAE